MKRRFLFLLIAVCTVVGANAALNRAKNFLEPSAATATAGKTVEISVLMTNEKDIINWQTELVLPEGITLVENSAVGVAPWDAGFTSNGNTLFSEIETGVAAGTKVVVAKFTLQIASTVAAGEYDIAFSKTVMNAQDGASIVQTDNKVATLTVEEAQGIKGDLNNDTKVNSGDIQTLLNIIAEGTYKAEADLNNDTKVNSGDIQTLLNLIAAQ